MSIQSEKLHVMGVSISSMEIEERNDRLSHWTNASHWKITARRGSYSFQFLYSMGEAHRGIPKIDDVFYSLLMDASMVDSHENLDDFASNMGYNNEDKQEKMRANRVWRECKRTDARLNHMFTEEEIKTLHSIFEDF